MLFWIVVPVVNALLHPYCNQFQGTLSNENLSMVRLNRGQNLLGNSDTGLYPSHTTQEALEVASRF